MRFKLDENLDRRAAKLLEEKGHDAKTVVDQALGGAADPHLAEVCRREQRCLVTLDLDFSNILAYPPENYAGIIVLRPPSTILRLQRALIEEFAERLGTLPLEGCLWIVEVGRIRIHEGERS